MAKHMRVMLEIGPKGKKVVAVAPDWPGLERGAKTGRRRSNAYSPTFRVMPGGETGGRMEAAFANDHRRRRGRALSGHGLNRLLGHLVRVFGHSTARRCRAKIGA